MKNYWYKTGMLAVGLLALTGCSTNNNNQSALQTSTTSSTAVESTDTKTEYSSDNNIKEVPNDDSINKALIILDDLDYDKVFVSRNRELASDPRFANVTPDGKVDWRQEYVGEVHVETSHLIEQITLNGKPVTLPTTFAELNPAYTAFDSLDIKNVIKDNVRKTFENTSNGKRINFFVRTKTELTFRILNDKEIEFFVQTPADNFQQEKIFGVASGVGEPYNSRADLRIAGIGVGNTLNEMYAIFGEPTSINFLRGLTVVSYQWGIGNVVTFISSPRINNPFTGSSEEVFDNVITGVSVYKYESLEQIFNGQ